jgi:uncharacterized repeat protein (TIGR03806 family)
MPTLQSIAPVLVRMKKVILVLSLIVAVFVACVKDDADPPAPTDPPGGGSPVVFDPAQVPYPQLSTYHFFEGALSDLAPSEGVLPYMVITPLFSDYAHKSRFVWMMPGSAASYDGDHRALAFEDGAVLIKNFYYDNVQPAGTRRIIETRMLYKKDGAWHFANYVWNDQQTDAYLDLDGSYTPVTWMDENNVLRAVNYRIPSGAECFTCHKIDNLASPIGPKPQNMKMDFAYADGTMDQLAKWEQTGYLAPGTPSTVNSTVRWDDANEDLTMRVRAYVDMNCAHCHAEGHHCDYRPMRFAWNETTDPVNLGVCVEPDEVLLPILTHIVARGNTEKSTLFYRIAATEESVRMPLLGRTLVHEEGVQLFEEWINSLTPPCN